MPAPAVPTILGREPGAMGGSNTVASVQVPIYMLGDKIWQWHKEKFPFSSITMKAHRDPAPKSSGYHLEDKEFPHWLTYNGSDETAGSEETSAFSAGEIVGWDRLNKYDLVFNPRSEEVMLFTTTISDTATIIRGGSIGSTTRPLLKGDTLLRYSSMKEEGGSARDAMSTIKERKGWYAQIFRHSTELTLDTEATEMYGGSGAGGKNERLYQRRKWAYEHKREIAQSQILNGIGGDYASATSTTYGHQKSWGLMGLIQTHIWNCNGSLKWDALKGFLMSIKQYNDGPVMLMTSQKGIDIITSYGNDFVRITPNQKYWGWEFDEVHVGGGKVALVHEPLLDEDSHLAGMGFIGSPTRVYWHPHIGNGINLDTQMKADIKKEDNSELVKDEFVTHGGWEFFIEAGWGRFYGA